MSYEIIWESHGVIKRFVGEVTDLDMMKSVIDTESDARFDDLRYTINDFLAMTGFSFGLSEIDDIAVIDKGASMTNPRIRIAVVTTSPDIVKLATHYATSPMNAYPTKIFTSLADARAWIGPV